MKNPSKTTRTKIENLTEQQGAVGRKELTSGQLRIVTGGLMALEPCCCTMNCDVDCD